MIKIKKLKNYTLLFSILCLQLLKAQLADGKSTVAILDFEGRGINQMEAATLTDRLMSEMVSTDAVIMVERNQMAEILEEYDQALLIFADQDTNVQEIVIHLETRFKQKGYQKAFALGAQPCKLCDPCTISTFCQYPEKARPTLQACGIDVQATVNNNGWADVIEHTPCSDSHPVGMVLLR